MAHRSGPPLPSERAQDEELALSLVRGDLAFRVQRAVGLIPREGLGAGRRALALAALAWLPIAGWAAITGHAWGEVGEPLVRHYVVWVRCLVAIPLFVVAEANVDATVRRVLPYFRRSGVVAEADRPRFAAIVEGVARLRDRTHPWIALLVLVAAWTLAGATQVGAHELTWAEQGLPPRLGFGGLWLLYVARPLYQLLALAWLWRLFLIALLLARVARLPLAIVPTHADAAGGLGFVTWFARMLAPVVLGAALVAAARWAHLVVHHGVEVRSLLVPMLAFVLLALALLLSPMLVFAPRLVRARRRALLDYGALVARHGRLVQRRWIEGGDVGEPPLLAAPEIGAVADTVELYRAVEAMRPVPLDRSTVLAIALPAATPMLAVVALQIPLKEVALTVLRAVL